jgi:hypothetical protein
MGLCVYALAVPPDGRIATRGIGGERLRAVTVGRVAAIVGELARTPAPTDAALRSYDRVLRRLSGQIPALLPARFGTCVQDQIELTFILQSRQETLRTTLNAVRGRVQMTVRVVDPTARVASAGALTKASSSGTAYLRGRAAAAERERQIPGFDVVREAVRRWVRDERVEKRGGVASVYHLVPKAQAQRYRTAVEHSAHDAGLRVRVSGPFPPYAFSNPF